MWIMLSSSVMGRMTRQGFPAAKLMGAAVADGYAAADHDVRAQPDVVADGHRARIAQADGIAVFIAHLLALVGQHGMHGRDDAHVRTEIAMIADGHFCIVLNGEVIVAEQRIADGRMRAVVEKDRALKKTALAHFADELREDFRAVRSLIFRQLAVTLAQLVRAA